MIHLSDIWPIEDLMSYKVHFARWNKSVQPLEVFVRDRDEWRKWQEYRPARDEFNRARIFSLIQFYHESDTWLFGGVFDVRARHASRYEVALASTGAQFIGRLKIRSGYRERYTRPRLENHYGQFEVQEILREPYSGRRFPGYEDIDLSFDELEAIVKNDRPDWKAALANTKGVYLISDIATEKRYVGSAYGVHGLWSRWCSYVSSGHGGNVELRNLVSDPSLEYCRKYFRFALLEHRPGSASDEMILQRESYWKRILRTREVHGLNRN